MKLILENWRKFIAEEELNEGVYDQNIFKVVFLAGGPGSGKSFVTAQVTSGQGWKVVNSDIAFEYLLKKGGMSMDMTSYSPEEFDRSQEIRARAKKITGSKMAGYMTNRLGMIIDGTGADYDKIESLREKFDEIGYDSYMVFVNTSLEAARDANKKRARTVPDNILTKSWASVQENMGKFQNLFGKDNFAIVDNTRDPKTGSLGASKEVLESLWKEIGKFSLGAPTNPIAQKWIEKERGESDVPRPRSRTLSEEQ